MRGKYKKRPIEERFWSKVNKGSKCWVWTAAKYYNRYGAFNIKGRMYGAHRVSYEIEYGSIPKGMCVCHMCDNPSCVRPSHLFIGTHEDNMADANVKGRYAKGPEHVHSKLTEEQVKVILRDKRVHREIAEDYPVARETISAIKRGKAWKHIKR